MAEELPRSAAAQLAELNMNFGMAFPTKPPGGTSPCPMGTVRLGVFFDGTDNNGWRDWGKGFDSWKAGSTDPKLKPPGMDKMTKVYPDREPAAGAPPPNKGKGKNNRLQNAKKLPSEVEPDPDKRKDNIKKNEALNGPTNIAKLYTLFKESGCCQKRVYTTGVGGGTKDTPTGEMNALEAASGLGGRARIEWGIAWLTEFVNQNNHHLAIEKRVDTFGFSRGATQARDFINKATKARIENLRKPLNKYRYIPAGPLVQYDYESPPVRTLVRVNTYEDMRGILFEYLGIMDTVASEGIGVIFSAGNRMV